jgi:hypothetical protein
MFARMHSTLPIASLVIFALVLLAAPAQAEPGREVLEGAIVGVGHDAITVVDPQNINHDYDVDAGTKILKNGKPGLIGDLQVGDRARVMARLMGGKWMAVRINARTVR